MFKRIPLFKNKKYLIAAISIFLAVQSVIVYCMYNITFSLFSYICIILSTIFCAVMADGSRSWLFTQIGLIGTVGADLFLVFLPVQQRVPGMIFFNLTQIAYFLRIWFEDQNHIRKKVHLILRVTVCVAMLVITPIVLGSRLDAVALLSMLYYANLVCNLVFAFLNFGKSGVFAIALLAFVLSDTLLGFQSLNSYFLIPRGSFVFSVVQIGKGFFYPLYIISQVMIPISVICRRSDKKSESV